MENATFIWVVVGAGIGWMIAQVLLIFFQNEIFAFIDRLVAKGSQSVRTVMKTPNGGSEPTERR